MEVYMSSQKFSFEDWNILEFLKGRKKMIVTAVGVGLGYMISDSATIAVVAGAIVEACFALAEYWIKRY